MGDPKDEKMKTLCLVTRLTRVPPTMFDYVSIINLYESLNKTNTVN